MKSVLITGGTGFLGCYIARKLLKKNYLVTLFDISDLDAEDLLRKVHFIKADVLNKKAVQQAVKNNQYVVHAAAALPIQRTKDAIYSVNKQGTKNVLDASLKEKIKRLVFISTTAVYGIPKKLPEEENDLLDPIGYYGESKLEAEKLCLEYHKKGLSVNILRPKTFLGPERLGVFELWFEAIYTGKRIYVLGNGNNLYQLLSVSDCVDAINKALETKVEGEIFNIGAKEFGTWREDLGYVIKQAHSHSKITSIPAFPAQIILRVLERMNLSPLSAWHYMTIPLDSYVSIEKAEKKLFWHPKESNKKFLLKSYLWYKKNRSKVAKKTGITHRVGWNFKILNLINRF